MSTNLEDALALLADKYGRHASVRHGRWGFSQGSGYIPSLYYDTLAEAIAVEVATIRGTAVNSMARAETLKNEALMLKKDAAWIEELTQTTPGGAE